jgi:propanol-preferring alcohol dehydrogenase
VIPYHGVRRVLPKLTPGATAVVIGVGGLGSFAVQFLKVLSTVRVIAVDNSPGR